MPEQSLHHPQPPDWPANPALKGAQRDERLTRKVDLEPHYGPPVWTGDPVVVELP